MAKLRKIADKDKLDKQDIGRLRGNDMTLDEMEYDAELQKTIDNTIRREFPQFYKGQIPDILNPTDFTLLIRKDKPYILGKGCSGIIFLAQHNESRELVVIKAYGVYKKLQEILKECGYQQRAQIALEKNGFTPSRLIGFLKIKEDSPLRKNYFHMLSVLSIASLVKDVPLCLPLEQATNMLEKGKIAITKNQWGDIIYLLVKAVKVMNEAGVHHADYHDGNLCITYEDGRYNLSVLDFGESREIEPSFDHIDMHASMDLVMRITKLLHMKQTNKFAMKMDVIDDFDFPALLRELKAVIQEDLRRAKTIGCRMKLF